MISKPSNSINVTDDSWSLSSLAEAVRQCRKPGQIQEIEKPSVSFDEHDGWHLPGTEEPKETCGQWITVGCLDVAAHAKTRLDGQSHAGKIYAKRFQKSCFRADCKTCSSRWAKREASKAARRIERYSKLTGKGPIHLVASPPYKDWNLDHKVLRKNLYKMMKEVGVKGGACIYHPFRYNKELNEWYYSPHFQIICFGWVTNVGKNYYKTGWVVKNLGVRKTVYGTIHYLLTHTGIKKGKHSLVWFGRLSYSKLIMPKEPRKHLCPVCETPLYPIIFFGTDRPPPDEEFEGWSDAYGWVRVSDDYGKEVSCLTAK